MRGIRLELVPAIAQQCGAVPLGLAADVEVFLRRKRAAAPVEPLFLALEQTAMHDLVEVERARVAWQFAAFLDQRDPQTRSGKSIGRCGAPCARADDDRIESR